MLRIDQPQKCAKSARKFSLLLRLLRLFAANFFRVTLLIYYYSLSSPNFFSFLQSDTRSMPRIWAASVLLPPTSFSTHLI